MSLELVQPISGSIPRADSGASASTQPCVRARPDCMAVLVGWKIRALVICRAFNNSKSERNGRDISGPSSLALNCSFLRVSSAQCGYQLKPLKVTKPCAIRSVALIIR